MGGEVGTTRGRGLVAVGDGVAHAPGMSPLQALILNRMRERGWTPKQVEDRGVTHATLHRYMNPVALRQPPRKAVLEQLARALDLPLGRVEQAAVESVGYDYTLPAGVDDVAAPLSIEEAIEADPSLPPVAKAHLRSQVALLRHLRDGLPPELEEEQERRRQQAIQDGKGLAKLRQINPEPRALPRPQQ